jgi:hypothetical protein
LKTFPRPSDFATQKITTVPQTAFPAAPAADDESTIIRYLYSGQRKKAWDFFENNYKLGDKQEIMADIKKRLQGCAIYNYLYPQGR